MLRGNHAGCGAGRWCSMGVGVRGGVWGGGVGWGKWACHGGRHGRQVAWAWGWQACGGECHMAYRCRQQASHGCPRQHMPPPPPPTSSLLLPVPPPPPPPPLLPTPTQNVTTHTADSSGHSVDCNRHKQHGEKEGDGADKKGQAMAYIWRGGGGRHF